MIQEYIERKRLAKLGITTDSSKISAFTVDCYMVIDSELDKLRQDDERKK